MATKFPCSSPASLCDQSPNPLTNFSSESQDGTTFIGTGYSPNPPLLNTPFKVYACEAQVLSQISQEDADLAAQRQAVLCSNPCSKLFENAEQTVSQNCPDGTPYFFTVAAGTFLGLTQLEADRLAITYGQSKLANHGICMASLPQSVLCQGSFFSADVVVVTRDGPVTFDLTQGTLPPGIAITNESSSLFISGTPTTLGTYQFTIKATSAFGVSTQKTFSLLVTAITTPSSLPDAAQSQAYSTTLVVFNPDGITFTWSITGGTLPDGLSLNSSTGEISGAPTTEGSSNFTVGVSDGTTTCTSDFSLAVASGFDVCTDGIASLINNCYAISGYFDGLVPNTSADPPGDTVFDGTFKFADIDQNSWFAADVDLTNLAMVGQFLCNVQLQFRNCVDDVPLWRLNFNINSTDWRGEKSTGNTPEGVYTRVSGSAPGPATLTIVKIAGVSVFPNNTTCVS